MRARNPTVQLPQALLNQLAAIPDVIHPHPHRKPRPQLSRKEVRKQARLSVKRRKANFFAATPSSSTNGKSKRPTEDQETETPLSKHRKLTNTPIVVAKTQSKSLRQPAPSTTVTRVLNDPTKASDSKMSRSSVGRSSSRRHQAQLLPVRTEYEKREDAYIAHLESKLSGWKGKQKEGDGLDDLMELVSRIRVPEIPAMVSPTASSESASDEWDPNQEDSEWLGCEGRDLESAEPSHAESSPTVASPVLQQQYEPPDKLLRQLKGLLNRMSEANMSSIVDSVEDVYRDYTRHDMTTALTKILLNAVAAPTTHLDSYVLLYAAFVSALARAAFSGDFAPRFIQRLVEFYHEFRAEDVLPITASNGVSLPLSGGDAISAPQRKQAANLLLLLAFLYNLQLVSCPLMFDLVHELLEPRDDILKQMELREIDVELVLIIARTSGAQMRADDPNALKDIVNIIQERMLGAVSSRTRFMVETLVDLKNNKSRRVGNWNGNLQGGAAEALERVKKLLGAISKKRRANPPEPIRVTLADLRTAESTGKWWLVGAAWGGASLKDRQAANEPGENITHTEKVDGEDENVLMNLARKQGMNTSIRRAVFVVLMSSEDYVDACDRLAALKLKEVQQREIIKVLLHCCGNEKVYNPYYTLVCQQLCRTSHCHKITLQYSLWDFMRELGETKIGGLKVVKNLKADNADSDARPGPVIMTTKMKNVAKAYAWWIAKDCIGLGVLKPVDFAALKPTTRSFLQEILSQLFISSQVTTPLTNEANLPAIPQRGPLEEVFLKATRMETLAMGLLYFIGQTFSEAENETSFMAWAADVAKETLKAGIDGRL